MSDPEKKPIPNPPVDLGHGGFSNLDDEIRIQQEGDVEEERQREAIRPDPSEEPPPAHPPKR